MAEHSLFPVSRIVGINKEDANKQRKEITKKEVMDRLGILPFSLLQNIENPGCNANPNNL